ncbi:MAG TPA: hypothetical protein VMU39_30670 [Solirubrobacteraceae bacterium]|nr:hypothetical protein [Solirubrobacteraceae bacterium]
MTATRTETSAAHRSAWIDRRTVKPALLVLAFALLTSVVLPSINSGTSYRNPVRHGDVAELAAGITLTPSPGWDLATGALVGHTRAGVGVTATTELVDGSVNFDVQAAPFAGTASALLGRVEQLSTKLHHARGGGAATRRYPVTTRRGLVGIGRDFVGVDRQGSIVAFVISSSARATRGLAGHATREGVEIVVSGPKGSILRRRGDIVAMIRSIRTGP